MFGVHSICVCVWCIWYVYCVYVVLHKILHFGPFHLEIRTNTKYLVPYWGIPWYLSEHRKALHSITPNTQNRNYLETFIYLINPPETRTRDLLIQHPLQTVVSSSRHALILLHSSSDGRGETGKASVH